MLNISAKVRKSTLFWFEN